MTVMVALQLVFTYGPFMERLFEPRSVDFIQGTEIIGTGVALYALLEVEKWLRRRCQARRLAAS